MVQLKAWMHKKLDGVVAEEGWAHKVWLVVNDPLSHWSREVVCWQVRPSPLGLREPRGTPEVHCRCFTHGHGNEFKFRTLVLNRIQGETVGSLLWDIGSFATEPSDADRHDGFLCRYYQRTVCVFDVALNNLNLKQHQKPTTNGFNNVKA